MGCKFWLAARQARSGVFARPSGEATGETEDLGALEFFRLVTLPDKDPCTDGGGLILAGDVDH